MASESKKLRIRDRDQFENEDNEKQTIDFLPSIISLCSSNYLLQITLTPVKVLNCNAVARVPSLFSRAFCDIEYYGTDSFVFGDAFRTGMNILEDYFIRNTLPQNNQLLLVLQKLLDYLNGDKCVNINDPQRMQNLTEKELAIVVANHLFGKLAISSCYLVDENLSECENGEKCFCGDGSCEMTGQYGDTSIGNSDVWHGNLCIVINNDLPVTPVEDMSDSQEKKPAFETKVKSPLEGCEQLIAETVVFSFLQRKSHPERDHFLTPCIGITRTELLVMLYDSENDILLESSPIPLFQDTFSSKFSNIAILVSWLTVNYKYLGTAVPEYFKKDKSDFFVHAKSKLQVYQENVRFGGVFCHKASYLHRRKLKDHKANSSSHMIEHEKKLMEILWRPSGYKQDLKK